MAARTPIPEGVPPPAGDPVPQVDTHAKGRPADQLHQWAAERAPALASVTALEAYAYAARVAEVENPNATWAGRRWRVSAWWKAITAPTGGDDRPKR